MKKTYSNTQIFLHWISAVIIIWATVTGFWVGIFESAQPHKEWVSFVNVSLTTVFIPVFIFRIIVAFSHQRPGNSVLSPREEKMAHIGHLALYSNITVVLLTGVLMMERPINVFNWFVLPQPVENLELTHAFNLAHIIACVSLTMLVAGHILAVVKHETQGKPMLKRMKWTSQSRT